MNTRTANTANAAPAEGAAAAAWTVQRERSNLRTLRLMSWIATTLGRRIARAVLHPITVYFLCHGGAAAQASRQYLERVLGRPPRLAERYRHIHHFAATVLDRVYLLQERFEAFDIELQGVEHVDAVLAQGQGALLAGAHLGSFEALRALGQGRRGVRVAMLMYEDNARLINRTLQAIAPDAELTTIPLGRLEAMLSLREWLDGGGVAGLLADRTLPAQGQRSGTHWLPFLGSPAPFSDGPFRLAALLRRQVVFMAGLYHGGRRYELRFLPVADFRERPRGPGAVDAAVREALQRYVAIVEALCRETPYNWFNFFDFWTQPPGASAPAGAEAPSVTPAADDPPAASSSRFAA
ncbi:acyl-CoA synthetase [Aquabacterium sp. A7-Y]|uniref:LpxL/LpxP family acyltransferase n=1 Tax=Aquabacterium sp. A7-Y TaxID=1349605 RepID=UPI00223CAF09|nr:acyl-CoA synthetase [Aquabacterium sp. A7-Y]MCW7536448.1 acyl-CoA synthetase [Aquabacterium sp. A7-Y]